MTPTGVALSVIGGAVLLITGAVALVCWRLGRLRRQVTAAKSWPSTEGIIVDGSLHTFQMSLPRGGPIIRFGANITYEYAVGEVLYRNSRFNVDGPQYHSSQRKAEALLAKYPIGTEVTVFYDPAAPQNSALRHGAPSIAVLWFVLIFSVTLVAGLLIGLASEPGLFGRDPIIRF
jgi:hypothetical protein